MKVFRAVGLCSLLLWLAGANAAHWVIDFKGDPSDITLRRAGADVPLKRLMVLKPGDEITVAGTDAAITIDGDTDDRRVVTAAESPFVVPESSPPPGLLGNIRGWAESWWNTKGNQSTTTTIAVSKGDLDPELQYFGGEDVRVLAGTRHLYVSWQGGLAPFDVELASDAGETIAVAEGVEDFEAVLPDVELSPGAYNLRIFAGGSPDIGKFVVVDEEQLPARAQEILALPVPDEVRFGHLALYLSTDDAWRFEARQLAHRYNLGGLVDTLESDR